MNIDNRLKKIKRSLTEIEYSSKEINEDVLDAMQDLHEALDAQIVEMISTQNFTKKKIKKLQDLLYEYIHEIQFHVRNAR